MHLTVRMLLLSDLELHSNRFIYTRSHFDQKNNIDITSESYKIDFSFPTDNPGLVGSDNESYGGKLIGGPPNRASDSSIQSGSATPDIHPFFKVCRCASCSIFSRIVVLGLFFFLCVHINITNTVHIKV